MKEQDRDKIRKEWDRWHGAYERRAFRILQKGFRSLAQAIPLDQLNRNNYGILVETNVPKEDIERIMLQLWTEIGLIHGRRVITRLEREIGKKNRTLFNETFQRDVISYLRRFAGQRITSVHRSYVNYLIQQIALQMASDTGQDLKPITDRLYVLFRSRGFYRWQMLRIARTETTAAANYGALKAGDSVQILQEKVWITNEDERTRRFSEGDKFDHAIMDGIQLPKNTPFEQRGVSLQFPGDPNAQPSGQASAGMVINCRCSVQMVPVRDRNGRLIIRST